MIFERQADLIERKKKLKWTNREVANALGIAPGVASSKLNGFIVLTGGERQRLSAAFDAEEKARAANTSEAVENSTQQAQP